MNRLELRRVAPLVALVLAAACGSQAEKSDARAPAVPFIDQYSPAGKDATYDGTMYCGPAVLASIAKGRGQTEGLTDAALVELMAEVAGTTGDGTTGYGMIDGLQYLGMETAANPGCDFEWIDDQLAQGHDIIANGDFYAVPGRREVGMHAGHFIAITGARDDWSVYDVTDPAGRQVKSMTDWELQTFIESQPEGGFTISAW